MYVVNLFTEFLVISNYSGAARYINELPSSEFLGIYSQAFLAMLSFLSKVKGLTNVQMYVKQ